MTCRRVHRFITNHESPPRLCFGFPLGLGLPLGLRFCVCRRRFALGDFLRAVRSGCRLCVGLGTVGRNRALLVFRKFRVSFLFHQPPFRSFRGPVRCRRKHHAQVQKNSERLPMKDSKITAWSYRCFFFHLDFRWGTTNTIIWSCSDHFYDFIIYPRQRYDNTAYHF